MSERTTAEQVRICRADVREALEALDRKIKGFLARPIYAMEDLIEELKTECELARQNARWLEELTRPNPEPEPVPAVASAALDRRLVVGPTDAEMSDAAFQEALGEVFGSE